MYIETKAVTKSGKLDFKYKTSSIVSKLDFGRFTRGSLVQICTNYDQLYWLIFLEICIPNEKKYYFQGDQCNFISFWVNDIDF